MSPKGRPDPSSEVDVPTTFVGSRPRSETCAKREDVVEEAVPAGRHVRRVLELQHR